MNIYRRLTLSMLVLTIVTLGGAFATIAIVLDRFQERQLDDALIGVARTEAEEAATNRFLFSSRPGPAANDVGPLEKHGIMFDERGAVLSATPPFDAASPRLADLASATDVAFDFSFDARRYRGVVVAIPGYPARRLLLAASREDLDGDSRFVRHAMAIALGVSVGWQLVAIGWLVRRSMREHERIAATLRRIAAGDIDARVAGDVSQADLRQIGSDIDGIAGRLGALVEHQRRFIAHAAHELRSPIAALHGEIQQALRKERSPEQYQQSLTFLLKASSRLKRLAEDLLELARAEHPPPATEPVSIDLVLADAIDSLAPLATDKRVTIVRSPSGCAALAHARDVERIARNLLDNAIRHSPEGGTVHVEVAAASDVRVYVRDEGPGVPDADRIAIFEPFHRAPSQRGEPGAGLGLAIARELARRYGGDVLLGDSPNCFVLSLPRAGQASDPLPAR
jgi:two-component system, OmpR family, sensor kinase